MGNAFKNAVLARAKGAGRGVVSIPVPELTPEGQPDVMVHMKTVFEYGDLIALEDLLAGRGRQTQDLALFAIVVCDENGESISELDNDEKDENGKPVPSWVESVRPGLVKDLLDKGGIREMFKEQVQSEKEKEEEEARIKALAEGLEVEDKKEETPEEKKPD